MKKQTNWPYHDDSSNYTNWPYHDDSSNYR